MQPAIRKLLSVFICLCILFSLPPRISAEEESPASDITGGTHFSGTGYTSLDFLTDGDTDAYYASSQNASITLENAEGIGSIYLLFDQVYGEYTIQNNDTGAFIAAGKHGFLHEFLDLQALFGASATSITLDFTNGTVKLSEIFAFSEGTPPDFVQHWNPPVENGADLVLFTTHGDDEQLYFAGLLPYYAGELGYRVQVVYLTDHRSGSGATKVRMHEMLNGLWNVGITAYPVFGSFADFRIDDKEKTYAKYLNTYGVSEADLQEFVIEQIRRFKPLVAVGHDLKGEYGHGMHQVYSDLLTKALTLSGDSEAFPDSVIRYGTWEIPKLYLHLYEENALTLDYDQPLEKFDGMTAFEVSQKLGFAAHKSQIKYFGNWIYGKNNEITKVTQIKKYNPAKFGLYHSSVGADVQKNDLFENITTYAEQERLEQERLEQERLEQERLEQERLEQERLEQERLEQEKQEQQKQEEQQRQEEQVQQIQQTVSVATILLCSGGIAFFSVCYGIHDHKKRVRRRKARRRRSNRLRKKFL